MNVPAPTVMPFDRERWQKELHLSNFINAYYQYRDLQECVGARSVLLIGPGQGLCTQVLRWRGYDVTTFDIDATFAPDCLGSVHNLGMFKDGQFDAIIASHVLEHLAEPYLDTCLGEIARVGSYALIYLPVAGRHCQVRMNAGFKGIDVSAVLDIFNYFHKPDGTSPRYCQGQHFWEMGFRGFRIRDLKRRMSQHFAILRVYRNRDWTPSQNFVLKSKRVL